MSLIVCKLKKRKRKKGMPTKMWFGVRLEEHDSCLQNWYAVRCEIKKGGIRDFLRASESYCLLLLFFLSEYCLLIYIIGMLT